MPEDRHAFDVQPPLRRVIVDEADRQEHERSILEQGVDEQASPDAGAVDQDAAAAAATRAQVRVERRDQQPAADHAGTPATRHR